MDLVNAIQWPAMLVTVIAAWMGCLSKEVQTELGILVVPSKQCAVDCLGFT